MKFRIPVVGGVDAVLILDMSDQIIHMELNYFTVAGLFFLEI